MANGASFLLASNGECEGKRVLKLRNSKSKAELELYLDLQLVALYESRHYYTSWLTKGLNSIPGPQFLPWDLVSALAKTLNSLTDTVSFVGTWQSAPGE